MRRRWISVSTAGRIAAIEASLQADGPAFDAGGCLACGGLVETHIHLDKSNIIDRCAPEEGRQANSMQRVAAVKHTFTVEDVYERASRTLEKCIKHGATRMRTHLELDGGVEMRSFEAIEALRRDYAWAIDVEVCVFPQEGLTNNPRSDALLVEGLKRGAKVIGAAPNYDPDHAGQIHRVFDLAREFDVDIDMHLDSGNSPDEMDIHLVCELTEKYRLGGRVAVGHMCKLSTMPIADLRALARRIADAGVAVTVLPATELFMMGRDQEYNVRRGVADVNLLVEHGVNCSLSTNNVLNPFTPFGDASLLRMANLQANVCQISGSRAAARVLRHADRAVGAADEPEGLWDQGRQSGGYRGAGRDDAGAGGGGDLPSAGGVQARQAHGDAAAGGTAPAHDRRHCEARRRATDSRS